MMKKTLFFTVMAAAAILTNASCGGNKEKKDSNNTTVDPKVEQKAETKPAKGFPWDFPENIKLDNPDVGQYVLSPYTFVKKLTEAETPENETYIFYSTKLTEYGDKHSIVNGNTEMPNALIIPLPKGQKAKVGDIILTWWQTGSGLKRAIVTDASNPETPKVCYLDMDYSDNPDKPGFANRHANEQIKPNTFVALEDGKWQSGAQIAAFDGKDWKAATLIHATDDKVLALGFAGKIHAYKRSNCKLIPVKQDLKAGDNVHAVWVGTFKEGYKVEKIDKKIGRVWVEKGGKTEIKSILDVTKGL